MWSVLIRPIDVSLIDIHLSSLNWFLFFCILVSYVIILIFIFLGSYTAVTDCLHTALLWNTLNHSRCWGEWNFVSVSINQGSNQGTLASINYVSLTIFINHSMMVSRQEASFLIYQKHLIRFGTRILSASWSKMVYQVAF